MMILSSSVVHGKCEEPRVRMSWDTMVAHGKDETYIRAVEMAVEQDYQDLFSQVHLDQDENINQAHGTSGEYLEGTFNIHREIHTNRVYFVASSLYACV